MLAPIASWQVTEAHGWEDSSSPLETHNYIVQETVKTPKPNTQITNKTKQKPKQATKECFAMLHGIS